ncbi:MAG: DUF1016 domain-containing protein [Firmicutes bacterium]|nr:DUF1016 domain-containing protein [Bacillota bacterium]
MEVRFNMNDQWARALPKLRNVLARVPKETDLQALVNAWDEVLSRYQPVFSPDYLPTLTSEDFSSFLYFENNKHWTGLHRHVRSLTANMNALRQALAVLLDEDRPLAERFDEVVGGSMVKGFGKVLATAILLIAYPDRYGVWNNASEAALKQLGIWPEFDRGMTLGKRYTVINDLLKQLSGELGVDLWTLDALLWGIVKEEEEIDEGTEPPTLVIEGFRLERHLHEFLLDNWERTELGREWEIYREPGDEEAGFEYPPDVGRIDILARHKSRPAWLVVELKRGQTTDQVIGQVLRYMGWVKRHLASPDEEIKGLIISAEADKNLQYALAVFPPGQIGVMRYRVQFFLDPVNFS